MIRIGSIIFFLSIFLLTDTICQSGFFDFPHTKKSDHSISILYQKRVPGSYYLVYEFSELNNATPKKFRKVVTEKSGTVMNLKPWNATKPITYVTNTAFVRGIPNPAVDSLFIYALPWKQGKSTEIFKVGMDPQKYTGRKEPINWHSYGYSSASQDTVYSMRKGVVVQVVDRFQLDTTSHQLSRQNFIIVEHTDGTFAKYKGFENGEIFVSLGMTVFPHMPIGRIGITSKDDYVLEFSVYSLYDPLIYEKSPDELKNYTYRYKYVEPFFLTEHGYSMIHNKARYESCMDPKIKAKEMTRKELKRFMKNPKKY